MAPFGWTRMAAATAGIATLLTALVAPGAGTVAAKAPASLGTLFADNGAHFNAKAWQTAMSAAEGYGNRRLAAELQSRWHSATTRAAKVKVLAWWNTVYRPTTMNTYNLGPDFPSFSEALPVCKRFYGANKDWKTYCNSWYQSHFFEVTGWQYSPTTGISVEGMFYFSALPARAAGNMQNMVSEDGAIQLPVKFPQANAAWLAPDSPLPLIAYYNGVKNAPTHGVGLNSPTTHQVMTASQLQEFWGWTAPMVFAPQLWRIMAAAGFNPDQAGGPDVPPGAKPPAWSTLFWNALLAKQSGWAHPYMGSAPWGPSNPAPGFAGT